MNLKVFIASWWISWNIQHLRDFGSGLCDQLHRFCNTFGHFGLPQLVVKFSLAPYRIPAMAIHQTLHGSTLKLPLILTRCATVVSFLLQAYIPQACMHSPGHIVILTDLNPRQARSGLHRGRFYGKSYYTIYAWT